MTEHDLLDVVEIEETCGLSVWGWDAYRAELERAESIMLVARRADTYAHDAERLSGFIAARISSDEVHINNVGVRHGARRRGLGGLLLGTALGTALRRGAHGAILEVRAGNHAAQALYRRFGFVVAGRRRNYYKEPIEDALIMSKVFETIA
jgi:ribosomal-protein-alanine N-acetyltransferase